MRQIRCSGARESALTSDELAAASSASSANPVWATGASNKQGDRCDLPLAMGATIAGS